MLDVEFLVESFSLSILSMSSHCLLASLVFNEKWAVNLFEDPLCVTNCFFLAAFKILLLLLAFDNLIITYISVDFFEFFLIGCYWSSRIYRFMYLIKLGSFCLYFLKYFFYPFISLFSFRDFHDVYIGPFDGTPQILQILLTFLHFFFLLLRLDYFSLFYLQFC